MSVTLLTGVIRGRTIELEQEPELPDGQRASVQVEPEEPPKWLERFTVDPSIALGKLLVKGTRLRVEDLVELVEMGRSDEECCRLHPELTAEDVDAVRRYAKVPEGLRKGSSASRMRGRTTTDPGGVLAISPGLRSTPGECGVTNSPHPGGVAAPRRTRASRGRTAPRPLRGHRFIGHLYPGCAARPGANGWHPFGMAHASPSLLAHLRRMNLPVATGFRRRHGLFICALLQTIPWIQLR